MSVPNYQQFMLPLLKRLGDGQVHSNQMLFDALASDVGLDQEDRSARLNSGALSYRNRIGWASTYLKKAGLIESPKRAALAITQRGLALLAESPTELSIATLTRYPEFVAFHRRDQQDQSSEIKGGLVTSEETPQDTLERVHRELHDALADDLLERVKAATPAFFEQLVVDLMLAMGYGGSRSEAGRTLGRSGDGGIDGVIDEDRLGLEQIHLQAKRWQGSVGAPVIRDFAGSLEGARAHKGVLITTSTFSTDARSYVSQIGKKIVLIDGRQLAEYMIQYGVGVSTEVRYEIRGLDSDYFDAD